jgi:hypothetical protein
MCRFRCVHAYSGSFINLLSRYYPETPHTRLCEAALPDVFANSLSAASSWAKQQRWQILPVRFHFGLGHQHCLFVVPLHSQGWIGASRSSSVLQLRRTDSVCVFAVAARTMTNCLPSDVTS